MAKPGAPKPAKGKADDVEAPDVEVHDHVYYRTPAGPRCGRVSARGKHGFHVDIGGGKHEKVRHEHYMGHKSRVRPDMTIVDQGVDGMLLEDPHGRRRYVHDPMGDAPPPMEKSWPAGRLFLFARADEVAKAMGGRKIANAPGLAKRPTTDKAGRQVNRWMKTAVDAPAAKPGHKPDDAGGDHASGAPAGEGNTHGVKVGDSISFTVGGGSGKGEVVSMGRAGVQVRDAAGGEPHPVRWGAIGGSDAKPGEGKPGEGGEAPAAGGGGKGGGGEEPPVEGEDFSAKDFAAKHDLPGATVEDILGHFPPNTAQLILKAEERLSQTRNTVDVHKERDGEYMLERQALHRKIIYDGVDKDGKHYPGLLSPASVAAATPAPGEKPTFTILGGRGGSGKSWFAGKMYDPGKAIVLDADHIKSMLPEFQGWNASEVHDESGDIFESVTKIARTLGLNLVHDATMKTKKKAEALIDEFNDAGYETVARYMHLPRQEAAKRAVNRFLTPKQDGSGRYVPPSVVLGMKTNEESFDAIKGKVHQWSFHDNNVERGQEPKLIAQGGKKPSQGA